jgi:hypothetical protein
MTAPAAAESAAAGGEAPDTPPAAAAMRCPRCGRDYEAGLQFCPRDGAALGAAAPAAGLAGQVLGKKYLVERSLGRGAMGEVYLARHVRLAKPYAVKVMSRAPLDDPDALRRFHHFEAESASRLAHPHVATVYDVGDAPDGRVYFVMDDVPGESLAALVAREGALAPARAAAVAAQIAGGLGAAHELRLVHRELTPDNVLVGRRAGGADHATVVDFGVAKAVDGDGPGRTRTGLVVGTPELVAWPASVVSVMARVLARAPEERYQSAAAFGRDLLRAVEGWQWAPARRPLARTTDALPRLRPAHHLAAGGRLEHRRPPVPAGRLHGGEVADAEPPLRCRAHSSAISAAVSPRHSRCGGPPGRSTAECRTEPSRSACDDSLRTPYPRGAHRAHSLTTCAALTPSSTRASPSAGSYTAV